MIKIIMNDLLYETWPKSAVKRLTLAGGEHAFRQGDVARGYFRVESGAVEMLRHSSAGLPITLHRAAAGETLAEASLFSERYHCDCIAKVPTHLVRYDKAAVLARLQNDPDFTLALTRRLAVQVQDHRRHRELLAIRNARLRVLAGLAELGQKGTVIGFAATMGLTHEATYRALSQLVAEGLVERTGRGRYRVLP